MLRVFLCLEMPAMWYTLKGDITVQKDMYYRYINIYTCEMHRANALH